MVISVVGYGVAASMLEKVSGISWEKMLEEYINKPLGISAMIGYPNKVSEQQPWGHWARYGPLTPEPPDTWVKTYPPVIPGIDLNITIADYAKFLQEQLHGLRGEKAGLNKKTFDLMHFGIPDYSLGWQNAVIGNDRISYHTGESQLFMAHVELIPEKKHWHFGFWKQWRNAWQRRRAEPLQGAKGLLYEIAPTSFTFAEIFPE